MTAFFAQGLHGAGSREYDSRQASHVLEAIHSSTGRGESLTVEDLVARTDVPGRTVRAILSDADGVELLLGSAAGYFVCEFADDGDPLTRSLRSQIAAMSARVERRERYAVELPRRQGRLL
jgi:hypothetical protein